MRHYCTYFDHNYLARGLVLLDSLRRWSGEPFHLWVLALNEEAERILKELFGPAAAPSGTSSLAPLDVLDAWDVNRDVKEGGARSGGPAAGSQEEAQEEAQEEPQVSVVTLREVEAFFPALLGAKTNRNIVEYYFTLTPCWPLFLFSKHTSLEQVSYVDADMAFFADPRRIFEEIEDASIAITPHRFPEHLKRLEKCGRFNVGWLTFRRDEQGLACLERWQKQCLEWCYDRMEDGKFGDQAYLDEWPERYSRLRVLEHPGINAAMWNVGRYRLAESFSKSAAQNAMENEPQPQVTLDGYPLLLYHFHGFKVIAPMVYDSLPRLFGVPHLHLLNAKVYAPYLEWWLRESERVKRYQKKAPSGYLRNALSGDSGVRLVSRWISGMAGRVLWASMAERLRCFLDWSSAHLEAAFGQHFIVWNNRVLRLPWRA